MALPARLWVRRVKIYRDHEGRSYSPPEQYQSRGKQGPWNDIYAVAATMYRCSTGKVPSEAIDRLVQDDLIPPSQLSINIAAYFEKNLLKALAIKADERYQSVEEFQRVLRENIADETNGDHSAENGVVVLGKK